MKRKNGIIRTALIISAGLLAFTTFGQENYLPGYIITLHGDTLKGYIDYRNWSINPDVIYFKTDLSANRIKQNPTNIKSFGVKDEVYESAVVESEISPSNTNDLEYDQELKLIKDTTFLQALIKGKKSLYLFKNRYGKEQFYIKQDSSFLLLLHKKFIILDPKSGTKYYRENTKYIGLLSYYLKDCPDIQQKLTTIEYRKDKLYNLFQYYYDCTKSEIEFQKKVEKVKPEFGILAGVTLSTIKFTGASYPYLQNTDYNNSVNPTIGISLNLVLPRNQGKWSINNEIIFSTFVVSGYCEEYKNANEYRYTSTTIGNSHIKLNNMLRFKHRINNMFLFYNAGLSNGILINETNTMNQRSKYYSAERVVDGNAYEDIRIWELGFNIGLGTSFNKFSFECRYEYGDGCTERSYLAMATTRFYFIFGYRF